MLALPGPSVARVERLRPSKRRSAEPERILHIPAQLCSTLYVRPADMPSAAVILQTAMRLAAAHGWAGVSIRDIATAAGVSSSLVVHHYRTKSNLRAAVDQRAVEVFSELIDEFSGAAADNLDDGGELTTSLSAAFEARLGGDSPMFPYVRRLLVDGGEAAETLFTTVFSAMNRMLDDLQRRGIVTPSHDPAARTAFLLVNDLAVMLFRDQVTQVLGADPLSRSGMQRWGRTVVEVYRDGIFTHPDDPRKEVDDDRISD